MAEKLKRIPFFLLLISVFFVTHGVLENFGFVSFRDAGTLLLLYIGLTIIVAGMAWLLVRRNKHYAAILATVLMAFFFFYEAFLQFMKEQFPYRFFSSYSFLLCIGVLAITGMIIYFRKNKQPLHRLYFFLNVIFIIYVLIDIGWIILKVIHPPANPLSIYSFEEKKQVVSCDSCAKPNVYFLLFDEYASTISLKNQFNYDNSSLDSFLIKQGFHVNSVSNSNYNYTMFSMASVLNMTYIKGLDPANLRAEDFTHISNLIRDNNVINIFSSLGYQIKNYSIFDLAGHPTLSNQFFLPLKTKLITERTLDTRFKKSINSILINKFNVKYFIVKDFMKFYFNNTRILELMAKEPKIDRKQPKFVYAHLIMPHLPYMFNTAGIRKNTDLVIEDLSHSKSTSYLEYLPYTNKRIEEIVLNIRQNDPSSVILLCGDHGFRQPAKEPKPFFHFQNLNAVYFPDHNYSKWKDPVSFVNQFRIVFNQLYHSNLPLLKDSTIFLGEKSNGN